MPYKRTCDSFLECHLVLNSAGEGLEGYRLEAYGPAPGESGRPLASAALGSLNYRRLGKSLKGILAGGDAELKRVGNDLAEWLFVGTSTGNERKRIKASTPSLNPVGAYVQRCWAERKPREVLRVWLCLGGGLSNWLEFCGYVPFECLEFNRLLPVKVVHGTVANVAPAVATRRLPVTAPPLAVAEKLRVLLVYANPDEQHATAAYPHLPRLRGHYKIVETALDSLINAEGLFINRLDNPAPADFRRAMARFNPHVLVFAGHGYGHGAGGLVCVKEGAPVEWPFPELLGAVKEAQRPALRLAVFIACRSFVAAPNFLEAGIPAVVAMQPLGGADFPEESVRTFTTTFFSAIARFEPISKCHAATCEALRAGSTPGVALMPTLWLATRRDALFASPEDRRRGTYLEALLGKPEVALVPFPRVEGGVDFQAAYVGQTVAKERTVTATPSTEAGASPDGGRAEVEMPKMVGSFGNEVDLWGAIKEHHWVEVEAPAWAGKTTLCQWVLHECFEQTGWLPIFIRFRSLAQSHKNFQRYLEGDYVQWLGLDGREFEPELPEGDRRHLTLGTWLFQQWQAGLALLVLDGADEVFDADLRTATLRLLPSGGGSPTRPYILLTSRPTEDGAPLGFEKLSLKEFAPPEVEELVRRCGKILGKEEKARQFAVDIRDPEIRSGQALAAKPGHLVQMFASYALAGVILQAEEDLMNRVADRRFTIQSRVTPTLDPDEPVYKRRIAEEIAWEILFCRGGRAQNRGQILGLVGSALMRLQLAGSRIYSAKDAVIMLEDLCGNSNFLKRTQWGTYEFESMVWLEYFAACHLARMLAEGESSFTQWVFGSPECSHSEVGNQKPKGEVCSFSHYLWHSEWHGVILHLAAVMEDASRLLERIEQEPDDICHRMLILLARVLGRASKADAGSVRRVCTLLAAEDDLLGNTSLLNALRRPKVTAHTKPLCEALAQTLCNEYSGNQIPRRHLLAAIRLQVLDEATAVPTLIWVVKRRNCYGFETGLDAVSALVLSTDPQAVEILAQVLRDEDSLLSLPTAEVLGRMGTPASESVLIAALRDGTRAVRSYAASALDSRKPASMAALIKTLQQHEDWYLRKKVVEVLSLSDDLRAITALFEALQDKHPSVRAAVLKELDHIKHPFAMSALLAALRDNVPSVRVAAAYRLGVADDPRAVPALIQAFRDKDSDVREASLIALGCAKDPRAVPVLSAAVKDQNPRISMKAAFALAGLNDPRVAPILNEVLRLLDQGNGRLVIHWLTFSRNPQAFKVLLQALRHKDAQLRFEAALGLWRTKDTRALPTLIAALEVDDLSVRFRAARALATTNNSRAIDVLLEVLQRGNEFERSAAVVALDGRKDPRAMPALIAALQDRDWKISAKAAQLLGNCNDPRALAALIATMNHKDEDVRAVAEEALRSLSESLRLRVSPQGSIEAFH